MMVMPSNDSGSKLMGLARRFPGRIGWLNSPSSWKNPPAFIEYALDNDAFMAWKMNRQWNEQAWIDMLSRAEAVKPPLWALVPDVVADKKATLRNWDRFSETVSQRGFALAFAAQDGMTSSDVPKNADVVFIGGTTSWKWRTLPMWCASFPRVHVGRVNSLRRLWRCDELGAESVDGTGWLRESIYGKRAEGLIRWLHGDKDNHTHFDFYHTLDAATGAE